MDGNQDLIQETNIIPVINIDSGSPLAERSNRAINFDNNGRTSFKHVKNDDDTSSFLETSHKVFEKLSGSLTALSKSLRSSLELGSTKVEGELEPIEKSSFEYDIDVVGTSPCNKYIATWSSEDGFLSVFPVDQHGPRPSIFDIKTPFNKTNVSLENDTRIYLSISEDGQYVAISRMHIIKENQKDTPNMDASVNLDGSIPFDHTPQTSFVVYSIDNNTRKDNSILRTLSSMEILGPLIFVHYHTLVVFTKTNMHLFSTRHWILQNSIQIDALIHSSPNYSDNSNEYLVKIYNILVESSKHGYLIWPEEKFGLSVWDLNGILRQWFYVEANNISHTRNLFAISPKGDLVARFHEDINKKGGNLCIFHTSTALTVSDIEVPKSTFLISFLYKTDQIILCSQEGEGVRVQLWDCWAGLLVFEEKWTYLRHDKPLLFLGDKFLQAVGNELCSYSLFSNNSTMVIMEALIKTPYGCKTIENELLIIPTIERLHGMSLCWGNIYDKENVLLCKFKFEPWHNWNNCEIFIHWLDPKGKRFVMVGKYSVQIYKTKPKGNYLKIDLQYMWMTEDDEIKLVTLETRGDNDNDLEQTLLHVQLTNNESIILPLPEENDKVTYRIVTDACTAIHHLRSKYMHLFERLSIREQLKKLIESSIQLFPSAFNKISLGDNKYFYPMEDFILLGWDDLISTIFETDRYIPLFHNDEQTESALFLLVELQKSELVEQIVNYMIKHLKQRHFPVRNRSTTTNFDYMTKRIVQQPGFFWTLSNTLLDLYKYYPDKGILVMKESSYFTTSLEAPIRILQTKLGNPFDGEERTCYDELRAVTRRSRLPKGTLCKKIIDKKEIFYESILSKYFTASQRRFDVRTREDTGALIYYPEGTHYSDKKHTETYGIRQRQRKERLEDAKKTHPAKLCVVPWPDFCVYPPLIRYSDPSLFQKMQQFWNSYISPMHRSPFAEVALNGTPEMFSEVAMEAIIKFKWNKFARKLFLCNFMLYITHAILFCTIISIDSDLVPPEGSPRGWKVPLFILESFIPMIFLLQELRQMSGRWKNYWSSFFNYADLASFCLPLACSFMVVARQEPPPGLKSFAVLCVWLNALLQSRAFEGPGKFIAIVIEIGKKILTLFITLLIIVLGFANALFVLLRDIKPMDIVPTYNGTMIDQNTGAPIANITMYQTPQDNTNMWQRYDYSVLATYFFLGIGWDSVTTINPNVALYIMMVFFSLVAIIILMNILIGLITEVFSGSLQVGRQAWLRQRAELIAELELFMLFPSSRQHPDWFPHLVYYEAHVDSIKNWRRKLDMVEMGELDAGFVRKELKNVKDYLNDELKEIKGIVGQVRIFMRSNDGGDSGNKSKRSSII